MIELVNPEQALPETNRRLLQEFDPTCSFYQACREHSKKKPRVRSCQECKRTRLFNRIFSPLAVPCTHCGLCRFPQPVCVFSAWPGGKGMRVGSI